MLSCELSVSAKENRDRKENGKQLPLPFQGLFQTIKGIPLTRTRSRFIFFVSDILDSVTAYGSYCAVMAKKKNPSKV